MSRRISAAAAAVAFVAILAATAFPANADANANAATSHIHAFGIPGVYGVRAWGTYFDVRAKVQVTVCVKDTAQGVYGAGAVGLAFTSGFRHHNAVGAVTIGDDHSQCQVMLTPYTSHLVVVAFSGYQDGKVRQEGKLKQIY